MSISQDRALQLEDRMVNFSLRIIELCKLITKSTENQIITGQLIRSATSIGANYSEANNASSKLDFRNKIFIAKKEASESRYWLKLLSKVNPRIDTTWHIDEASQLLFILQKIISTLKNGK